MMLPYNVNGMGVLIASLLLISAGAAMGLIFCRYSRRCRKMDEAAKSAQQEHALLAAMMKDTPDHIFFKDTAGRFLQVNPAVAKKVGLSGPEQVIGKTDADFFSQEHSLRALANEQEIIRTGRPLLNLEEKETWSDGSVSWVLTTKMPLRDAAGQITGIYGISHDITEIKQGQALLDALMENIPDTIYFKDADSRFLRVNLASARRFGLSDPEQMVGTTDADYFTQEHALRALANEQEIIRTGQPLLNFEEKETWPDGSVSWVSTNKLPLRDAAGQIIGTCGISRDITGRKRAEAAQKSLISQLEVALAKVKTLSGLVPICSYCKKIRDDSGYWSQLESFVQKHTDAKFSHGICPECVTEHFPGLMEENSDHPQELY